jgi:hypothetical protein
LRPRPRAEIMQNSTDTFPICMKRNSEKLAGCDADQGRTYDVKVYHLVGILRPAAKLFQDDNKDMFRVYFVASMW